MKSTDENAMCWSHIDQWCVGSVNVCTQIEVFDCIGGVTCHSAYMMSEMHSTHTNIIYTLITHKFR